MLTIDSMIKALNQQASYWELWEHRSFHRWDNQRHWTFSPRIQQEKIAEEIDERARSTMWIIEQKDE